jgi:hypothetical protein
MNANDFIKNWKERYSDCPPVGYVLRERFPEIWFRVHGLPAGKRYPESTDEVDEVLRRHNALLDDLLGEKGAYILIATDYSPEPEPLEIEFKLPGIDREMDYTFSISRNELEQEDEPYYWHFFMAERSWERGSVNELINKIADDEIRNVLFVETDQNLAYHPYDGGADVFIWDLSRREHIKSKYSDWLSRHELGL